MGAFCSGSPYIGVALWRWDRGEPVPDARLVVLRGEPPQPSVADDCMKEAFVGGARFLWAVSGDQMAIAAREWATAGRAVHPAFIPALHVRTQADLARLPDLLAVKAERRALVLSPTEAIDIRSALKRGQVCECDLRAPREDRCDPKHPAGHMVRCNAGLRRIDLVIIAGFDEPLHPAHVRSIIAQCRAAGVPVVFAGWGEWVPTEVVDPTTTDDVMERLIGEVGWMVPVRYVGDRWHARVGAARSGALLDGEPVADLPEWVSA